MIEAQSVNSLLKLIERHGLLHYKRGVNRRESINQLEQESFDLFVVGGGATGAGIALDGVRRGLKVALVDRGDFSSETSSRSTKLIHGGIRYLEQAFKNASFDQYHLVREALKERSILLRLAPHLSRVLPILTPIYSTLGIPYYTAGLKLYDRVAGKRGLGKSRFMGPEETLKQSPLIKADGLKGAVLYYDGQFDDARMNITIAKTAATHGAVLANHVSVEGFVKSDGIVTGVKLEDQISGKKWSCNSKVVINATGPFGDSVRKLDDPSAENMLDASSGVHLVLPGKFCPNDVGVLIPKTEDGRVLFVLPWLGHTLVGTTDSAAKVESDPKPTPHEIDYIYRHLEKAFSMPIKPSDVLAAWSGLRPLVSNKGRNRTSRLSREHEILISASGLISVFGGKWTTYRKMAREAVDLALSSGRVIPEQDSDTSSLKLDGAEGYNPNEYLRLKDEFGIEEAVGRHLNESYGSHAREIALLAKEGYSKRLSSRLPYIEAEVLYCAREEMAETIVDILARRTRMGFLDQSAALDSISRVGDILAKENSWNQTRLDQEKESAHTYFNLIK